MPNTNAPKVTVGVTTYNRKEMLRECLASIINQDFQDLEVIVGNDYQAEPLTPKLVGISDPRIRYINYETNIGAKDNMNALMNAASGHYFTWLADDDIHSPSYLQLTVAVLDEHSSLPCVFTSHEQGKTPTQMKNVDTTTTIYTGREFLRRYLARELHTQGCYALFRTNYIRDQSGMRTLGDSDYSFYADNLIAIRAGQLPRVPYIHSPLMFLRTHGNSSSTANGDFDAYVAAQIDFVAETMKVLRSDQVRRDLRPNSASLLRWCFIDLLCVMWYSRRFRLLRLMTHSIRLMRLARERSLDPRDGGGA